jgi:CheY-like chemotaxis protein
MDIMMPEMDGKAAVREIRAMEESTGIPSTGGSEDCYGDRSRRREERRGIFRRVV